MKSTAKGKSRSNEARIEQNPKRIMVEEYYKKIMRVIEYYVLFCFIIITFVPLLEYSWVPGFIKFIYMTGFPLLLLLLIISLVKEPLLNYLTRSLEK
ncbi:hypothetical protein B1H10_02840 [candidate division KSB1 bacterium 4484_188]|nr:MAG: hypothetical protein B1H10_02840 [candidate division KSB1 bacterium 4484_188]HFE65032.1 hypothetical protein [Caldithrix sp.]